MLAPFSAKLQLAVLMPHFLPMWSLFKADVIDFIPYNWPWDAALAWRDMSVASRLFFNLSTGSLHPPPPSVQKYSRIRARAMQMKRQFNRVLLILVKTWMILIITRSLSLIGPFSKSTFARAALIHHSVDMLQAYIGIKYLRAELWWCLSCQGGWVGGGIRDAQSKRRCCIYSTSMESKEGKDAVLLLESTNASLFIFTQHKVNSVPHLLS